MGLLDWIKNRNETKPEMPTEGSGWRSVGVYFYRPDGRYPPASWAQTPQQFVEMIPQIKKHLDEKLEVRITNGDDHLLFHATQKGIEWDGIGLSPILDHERSKPKDLDARERSIRNTQESAKGNRIRIIGEWRSNGPASHEFKNYVGRSIEGYHGGFEAAPVGGDGVLRWSNARPTVEAAVKACRGMRDAWKRGHEHKLSRARGVSWDR
jgi:hypothetical protein